MTHFWKTESKQKQVDREQKARGESLTEPRTDSGLRNSHDSGARREAQGTEEPSSSL